MIITGLSGAGKSTAMAVFEDEGYFCVDNLPSEMIRSLVDLFMHEGSKVERAAVVSDVRGGTYFDGLAAMLDDLRTGGVRFRVLFLEADEQTLLTRYKETRRRHPLAPSGSVADGIAREHKSLAPLRARADVVIDTTGLTAAMLRRKLADELLPTRTPGRLAVTFESFGFKYGPAARPRPAARRPVPPQPALRGGAAAAHRRRPADRASSSTATGRSTPSTSACTRCSTTCSRSTCSRARPTWWWRSAAPAGATGRWRSPSIWRSATGTHGTT